MTTMSVTARRPAQLERADRRRPLGRADRAPALGLVGGGRGGRPHRRPDHADARPHEHELPHPLRALPDPRLGRRHGAPRGRAHGEAGRSRRCAPCSTSCARSKEAGVFRGLSHWGTYVIGDTYAPANDGCAFRTVADIAAERGTAPFDTLLDIVLADELRTVLWPNTDDGDETTWGMRAAIWSDPRAMVGGSDAGAHLDRMCGSNYPTAFLGDCLRGRKLVPVEQAVHMMTGAARRPLRAARARPGPGGIRRRPVRLRPRHRGLRAGPPGARPARRHAPALRRLPRRRPGPGQRGRDGPRRCADRRRPGHPAALRPRHRVGGPRPRLSPHPARGRRLACLR